MRPLRTFDGSLATPTVALEPSVKSGVHFIEVFAKFKW
jgi:hypothetical protein